ncbi:uncharacterized protein LOC129572226 [Sitodiplosis mosellana]|uniref:uncharacterized protein LOC129572226 n=1 Tax=Sitodiplosis mosellana TaxID=263140 RepID=UPI002443DE6D|nr:uncharacterized protein LOC129572226 [Sitodiplosis mosellana]
MNIGLVVIFCLLGIVCGKTFDYVVTGSIESVFYGSSKEWPCYVAVRSNDENNSNTLFYHAANNIPICEFAERSRTKDVQVNLYGKTYPGQNNAVDSIEYSDTNAKFWYRY